MQAFGQYRKGFIKEKLTAKGFFWLFFVLAISSCEGVIDWNLDNTPENIVVVNARITNEFKIQEIYLAYPVPGMNDMPESFTGAVVSVAWGQQVVWFTEHENNPGTYLSNQPFAAAVETTYLLTIEKDELYFEAQTYMLPVLPYNLPHFSFHQNLGLYSINWNNEQYSPLEQALLEADIDWSHLPGYDHPDSVSLARMLFYTLSTIDVSYIVFPQDKEQVYFPGGSNVMISKYSLNNEYGAYLRALLSETQWQGSLFESARGNLPGNISNGGLGYFSACAVIRTTLVVE
jgi:hypothetical protein